MTQLCHFLSCAILLGSIYVTFEAISIDLLYPVCTIEQTSSKRPTNIELARPADIASSPSQLGRVKCKRGITEH